MCYSELNNDFCIIRHHTRAGLTSSMGTNRLQMYDFSCNRQSFWMAFLADVYSVTKTGNRKVVFSSVCWSLAMSLSVKTERGGDGYFFCGGSRRVLKIRCLGLLEWQFGVNVEDFAMRVCVCKNDRGKHRRRAIRNASSTTSDVFLKISQFVEIKSELVFRVFVLLISLLSFF